MMKTYLRVLEAVESSGVRAWLAGDPVRDIVMGVQPLTLTVVVERCDLEALKTSLGEGAILGPEPFRVLHTSIYGSKAEISCMQGSSIEEDLARRDFTMNAIAIRSDDSFADPFNGRHDIRNSLIRLTGDDIDLVRSDPIRIVRMFRFAAELDMRIFWKSEEDVRAFISRNAEQIRDMPLERWGREILNGMRRCPYDFISMCDHFRVLPLFLSELEDLKGVLVDGGGSLFDHTLDTVKIVQTFLSGRKPRENDMAFSLASLFHHAGSAVNQPSDTARAAGLAARRLKSWNVNADTLNMVCTIIRHYRLPYSTVTEEQFARAILEHGAEAVEIIVDFAICNSQADKMKNMETLAANKWKLGEVLRRYDETRRRMEGSSRYLTGDEVMTILRLQPGRVVGEILSELDIAVGAGLINSKKEAADWVSKHGGGA
jgi:tRNA nucleotidyltransferase/poly(A) polymerase